MTATEDDEVIGIHDDACTERITASGEPPVLCEPVHVDVCAQWARNTALRGAPRVALASTHAPFPAPILLLDRRFEPQLDQPQHLAVHNASSHRFDELAMRNRIEVFG